MTDDARHDLLELYKEIRRELLQKQAIREETMRFAIVATAGAAAWLATTSMRQMPAMAYGIPLYVAVAFFLRVLTIRRDIRLASAFCLKIEARMGLQRDEGWQQYWNERNLKFPGRALRLLFSSEVAIWLMLIGGSTAFLFFYVPPAYIVDFSW